ncbi:MAG TPA: Flp family type IVb pilin [Methyloceanibacter sp.]|jgi:pilus assembly protein Flp/PilA|nr:Flp family type IVb pilin [Methyloceanibacter sp.]
MNGLFARFAADESAATATEYGLIAAGIGVAIVSIVGQVGPQLGDLLDRVVTQLKGY